VGGQHTSMQLIAISPHVKRCTLDEARTLGSSYDFRKSVT